MDLKEIEQFLDENTPAFLATLGTCEILGFVLCRALYL